MEAVKILLVIEEKKGAAISKRRTCQGATTSTLAGGLKTVKILLEL